MALAAEIEKDPRLVEVILSELRRIVRHRPNLVDRRASARLRDGQCRHRPLERRSRRRRRARAAAAARPRRLGPRAARGARRGFGSAIAVIISDSFGRPWRRGTVGIALGAAGLPALIDWRGQPDLFGRTLEVTETGFADEIAAAASLLHGPGRRGDAVVLVRGLAWSAPRATPRALVRPDASTTCSDEPAAAWFWRCRAGSAAPSWRSGLYPRAAARTLDRGRQYRRRFRASRPRDLARSRHAALYAVRAGQPASSAGAGAARPGISWRRSKRSAARPGSGSATATSPPMSSARGGSRAGETPVGDHRRFPPPPRHRRAARADERRPGAHAPRDDRGLARFPGLFRAAALRARGARRSTFAGAETARPQPDFFAALADPRLRAVVICPSNPFISIEPILAVPGVRAGAARVPRRRSSRCRRSSPAGRSRARPRR